MLEAGSPLALPRTAPHCLEMQPSPSDSLSPSRYKNKLAFYDPECTAA